MDGAVPPTFWLDSWDDLVRALSRIPPGQPLFAVHIDLKDAFWSFRPPPRARRIFRFQPGPGLPAVELERLSSKQHSRVCSRACSLRGCCWCTI